MTAWMFAEMAADVVPAAAALAAVVVVAPAMRSRGSDSGKRLSCLTQSPQEDADGDDV